MEMPDKKTVIRDLIELGKSKGQLSTKEILDALGELDFEPEQIEKFYDTLESQGVEIIEDFANIPLEGLDIPSGEGEDVEAALATEGIAIDDPVKVYLKEIGRVHPRRGNRSGHPHFKRRRSRKEAPFRSEPSSGRQHRQALPWPRNAVPRPDSGGKPRPH